jgi:hypothetical protein
MRYRLGQDVFHWEHRCGVNTNFFNEIVFMKGVLKRDSLLKLTTSNGGRLLVQTVDGSRLLLLDPKKAVQCESDESGDDEPEVWHHHPLTIDLDASGDPLTLNEWLVGPGWQTQEPQPIPSANRPTRISQRRLARRRDEVCKEYAISTTRTGVADLQPPIMLSSPFRLFCWKGDVTILSCLVDGSDVVEIQLPMEPKTFAWFMVSRCERFLLIYRDETRIVRDDVPWDMRNRREIMEVVDLLNPHDAPRQIRLNEDIAEHIMISFSPCGAWISVERTEDGQLTIYRNPLHPQFGQTSGPHDIYVSKTSVSTNIAAPNPVHFHRRGNDTHVVYATRSTDSSILLNIHSSPALNNNTSRIEGPGQIVGKISQIPFPELHEYYGLEVDAESLLFSNQTGSNFPLCAFHFSDESGDSTIVVYDINLDQIVYRWWLHSGVFWAGHTWESDNVLLVFTSDPTEDALVIWRADFSGYHGQRPINGQPDAFLAVFNHTDTTTPFGGPNDTLYSVGLTQLGVRVISADGTRAVSLDDLRAKVTDLNTSVVASLATPVSFVTWAPMLL